MQEMARFLRNTDSVANSILAGGATGALLYKIHSESSPRWLQVLLVTNYPGPTPAPALPLLPVPSPKETSSPFALPVVDLLLSP